MADQRLWHPHLHPIQRLTAKWRGEDESIFMELTPSLLLPFDGVKQVCLFLSLFLD